MCIICVKKPGIKLPPLETFERCFSANPDGAGYMYPRYDEATGKAQIIIRKGFMKFEAFAEDYKKFLDRYGEAVDAMPMVLHFRIGTHGSKDAPEHTHPFPIVDDYSIMENLNIACDRAVAHNGIYSIGSMVGGYSKFSAAKPEDNAKLNPSDTMEFAKKVLWPVSQIEGWMENAPLQRLVTELNGSCRLVVMEASGASAKLAVIGNFSVADDGMLYSNEGYKVSVYKERDYGWSRSYDYYEADDRPDDYVSFQSYYDTHVWDTKKGKYVKRDANEDLSDFKKKHTGKTKAKDADAGKSPFFRAVKARELAFDKELAAGVGYGRIITDGMLTFFHPVDLIFSWVSKNGNDIKYLDFFGPDKDADGRSAETSLLIDDPAQTVYITKDQKSAYWLDTDTNTLTYLGSVKRYESLGPLGRSDADENARMYMAKLEDRAAKAKAAAKLAKAAAKAEAPTPTTVSASEGATSTAIVPVSTPEAQAKRPLLGREHKTS